MNLEKFLSLDGELCISPEEAQLLNEHLAKVSVHDIPVGHKAQVADYLISALNMDSVEHRIRPALDALLSELQTRA